MKLFVNSIDLIPEISSGGEEQAFDSVQRHIALLCACTPLSPTHLLKQRLSHTKVGVLRLAGP